MRKLTKVVLSTTGISMVQTTNFEENKSVNFLIYTKDGAVGYQTFNTGQLNEENQYKLQSFGYSFLTPHRPNLYYINWSYESIEFYIVHENDAFCPLLSFDDALELVKDKYEKSVVPTFKIALIDKTLEKYVETIQIEYLIPIVKKVYGRCIEKTIPIKENPNYDFTILIHPNSDVVYYHESVDKK